MRNNINRTNFIQPTPVGNSLGSLIFLRWLKELNQLNKHLHIIHARRFHQNSMPLLVGPLDETGVFNAIKNKRDHQHR